MTEVRAVGVSRPPASLYRVLTRGAGLHVRELAIVDGSPGDQSLVSGEWRVAWKESWRVRFRLVTLESMSLDAKAVVL